MVQPREGRGPRSFILQAPLGFPAPRNGRLMSRKGGGEGERGTPMHVGQANTGFSTIARASLPFAPPVYAPG